MLAVAVQSQKMAPVECDWDFEILWPGMDVCMANKDGDCWVTCPIDCGEDTICPGEIDPKGCAMPSYCMPAGEDCPKM